MSIRGVLCFLLLVVTCIAVAQACDQECRLLRLEQAMAQQTDVLRSLLQSNKEMAKTLKDINTDTTFLKWKFIWK